MNSATRQCLHSPHSHAVCVVYAKVGEHFLEDAGGVQVCFFSRQTRCGIRCSELSEKV